MSKNQRNPSVHKGCFLFAVLVGVAWVPARAEVDEASMDRRRERVRAMSPEEVDRLRRNYRQFDLLARDEKEGLRQLYEQIEAHPDRAQLRVVMENYHRWVSGLSPADREDMLSTPAVQRVAKIRELRRRQLRGQRPFRRFGRGADRRWMGQFAYTRIMQDVVAANLTDEQREAFTQTKGPERLRLLLHYAREQELLAGTDPLGPDKVSDDQLRAIVKRLPGPSDLPLATQRKRLSWQLRLWAVAMTRRRGALPVIPEDVLQRFYTEEVQQSDVARGHFERMGGSDRVREGWKRDLTLLYLEAYPDKRPETPKP